MILSNSYYSLKVRLRPVLKSTRAAVVCLTQRGLNAQPCLVLATISTIIIQAFFTMFSSYKHYAIANADTLPAAVTVSSPPVR